MYRDVMYYMYYYVFSVLLGFSIMSRIAEGSSNLTGNRNRSHTFAWPDVLKVGCLWVGL